MRLYILIGFLPCMLILSACKNIENIEIKGIDKVVVQGFQDNKIYFTAGLKVYNPSGVSFKLREINLKTVADGSFLGTLQCTDEIKVMARADSVYMVPLNLRLANIFTGASSLYRISRQKKVKLELQGYVRVKTFLISRKIEISESQVIDVPKLR
jgi:LEA14-like dessication related protein